MQVTIARQLGLEPTTVGNFFMNARRRSHDKWREDGEQGDENDQELCDEDFDNMGHTIMEEDENVKYEVYDNGSTAHMYTPQEQAFLEATGGIPTQQQRLRQTLPQSTGMTAALFSERIFEIVPARLILTCRMAHEQHAPLGTPIHGRSHQIDRCIPVLRQLCLHSTV